MPIKIGDNFAYQGEKFNFDRDCFETLADMKAYPLSSVPNNFKTYCREDNKEYRIHKNGVNDPITGYWTIAEADVDLTNYYTKEEVYSKSEIDNKNYVDINYFNMSVNSMNQSNANIYRRKDDSYNKSEVDNLISGGSTEALKNYYTKSETNTQISGAIQSFQATADTTYAPKSNTYTKEEVDAKIGEGGGADMTNYYTKTETNTLLENKADDLYYVVVEDIDFKNTGYYIITKVIGDVLNESDITTNTTDKGWITSNPVHVKSGNKIIIKGVSGDTPRVATIIDAQTRVILAKTPASSNYVSTPYEYVADRDVILYSSVSTNNVYSGKIMSPITITETFNDVYERLKPIDSKVLFDSISIGDSRFLDGYHYRDDYYSVGSYVPTTMSLACNYYSDFVSTDFLNVPKGTTIKVWGQGGSTMKLVFIIDAKNRNLLYKAGDNATIGKSVPLIYHADRDVLVKLSFRTGSNFGAEFYGNVSDRIKAIETYQEEERMVYYPFDEKDFAFNIAGYMNSNNEIIKVDRNTYYNRIWFIHKGDYEGVRINQYRQVFLCDGYDEETNSIINPVPINTYHEDTRIYEYSFPEGNKSKYIMCYHNTLEGASVPTTTVTNETMYMYDSNWGRNLYIYGWKKIPNSDYIIQTLSNRDRYRAYINEDDTIPVSELNLRKINKLLVPSETRFKGYCNTKLGGYPTNELIGRSSNIRGFFAGATFLEYAHFKPLDKAISSNMMDVFKNCFNLREVTGLDLSGATDIRGLFSGCYNLERVEFSKYPGPIAMDSAFENCVKLKFNNFDFLREVKTMGNTFNGCRSIEKMEVTFNQLLNGNNMISSSTIKEVDFIMAGETREIKMSNLGSNDNCHTARIRLENPDIRITDFWLQTANPLRNLTLPANRVLGNSKGVIYVWSTTLSDESVANLIEAIGPASDRTYNDGVVPTVRFNQPLINRLTQAQKDMITAKGYLLTN